MNLNGLLDENTLKAVAGKDLKVLAKLDKNGLKKSSCRVEDRVVGLNMYGDYAYIITEHSVIRFTAPDASQTQIYRSHRRIYSFVAVSGREYVCFSDTMTEIGFDDNDKNDKQ